MADAGVGTTGGGDNNVLVKQTGMYLIKLGKSQASKLTSFLFEDLSMSSHLSNTSDLQKVLQIFSIRSRNAVILAKQSKTTLDLIASAEHWYWRSVLSAALEYSKVWGEKLCLCFV